MKYGKKTIAILTTAVCLIGVLPLFVYAAYESVYVPPIAALTTDTRYSASNQGYVAATGNRDALTIPLPIDKTTDVVISFGTIITIQTEAFYVDGDYKLLHTQSINAESATINLNSNYAADSSYIVFNIYQVSNWDNTLYINEQLITLLEGAHTLAQHERYEQIEVPDDTEPPDQTNIVENVLTMWQKILTENLEALGLYYNELTKPIALIIGIPICIAIIGLIFYMLGGKKR